MDKGFSLPCYQNFGKTIKLLTWKAVIIVQGRDISLPRCLVQMGCS